MCLLVHYTYTCAHPPETVFKPCQLRFQLLPSLIFQRCERTYVGSTASPSLSPPRYYSRVNIPEEERARTEGEALQSTNENPDGPVCPRLWIKHVESPVCVACLTGG